MGLCCSGGDTPPEQHSSNWHAIKKQPFRPLSVGQGQFYLLTISGAGAANGFPRGMITRAQPRVSRPP